MARKLRVQYPGAIYHLLSRGDRHESDAAKALQILEAELTRR